MSLRSFVRLLAAAAAAVALAAAGTAAAAADGDAAEVKIDADTTTTAAAAAASAAAGAGFGAKVLSSDGFVCGDAEQRPGACLLEWVRFHGVGGATALVTFLCVLCTLFSTLRTQISRSICNFTHYRRWAPTISPLSATPPPPTRSAAAASSVLLA
jgi:hypothetical protein